MIRTIDDVLRSVPSPVGFEQLPKPGYHNARIVGFRFGLAVESMKRHTTNEGWELFAGLESAGYDLFGYGLLSPLDNTHVPDILSMGGTLGGISTLIIQDKREWEGLTADRSRDPAMRFTDVEALATRPDIFKLTVLKDSQHDPEYNRQAATEIGCHAWIVYYHPRIVKHLAPYVRQKHLVRTYHSIDRDLVPMFNAEGRGKCILSGALSKAYPLRTRIKNAIMNGEFPSIWLAHPGYHRDGCATPTYLQTLSRFKVAICTSSIYGYAVRKIVEATACGCAVVTDLPADDVLPEIDGNLIRVHPDATVGQIAGIVNALVGGYDKDKQQEYAGRAANYYDYRVQGKKLADDIEELRRGYNDDVGERAQEGVHGPRR